jgi:hypothetical protein
VRPISPVRQSRASEEYGKAALKWVSLYGGFFPRKNKRPINSDVRKRGRTGYVLDARTVGGALGAA